MHFSDWTKHHYKCQKKSDRSAKASVIRSPKELAMNMFEDFAKAYGDRMMNTKDILLPYKTRQVCVFEKYKTDVQSSACVSKTMFFSLWLID